MWNIRTRKSSGATRSSRLRDERGQAILEYILVLIVVLSLFVIVAKPAIGKLGKKINEGLKGGIFSDDPSGAGFYYYPIK